MSDVKSWVASKTVWASVIGFILAALQFLHHPIVISADDLDGLETTLASVGAGIAFLVSLYGRITAKAAIGTPSP